MYKAKEIIKYSAKDLMDPDVKAKVYEGIYNDDTYYDVFFGVSHNHPIESMIEHAKERDRLDEMSIYQIWLSPRDDDNEEIEDDSIIYENMPYLSLYGGCQLAGEHPICCSVHDGEKLGVFYTFSDVNTETGKIDDGLVDLIVPDSDLAQEFLMK